MEEKFFTTKFGAEWNENEDLGAKEATKSYISFTEHAQMYRIDNNALFCPSTE